MTDAAYSFVPFIVNTTYDDLPAALIAGLKDDVLDTMGNMLAGRADPLIEKLIAVQREIGSSPESSVLLSDVKLSAGDAAFINASMAFCLDYDDIHEPARLHFGCAAVPAALAVAEWQGGFSGRDILTALAVALEIGARLGKYMERRNPTQVMGGWDYAGLHGVLTSAVVAGRLMKLNEEQMHNALGIAFHQCAGTSISAMDNAHTKILSPGFAARGGILAARLAKAGVTGAKRIFDGTEISMAAQYHNGCDSEALAGGLGTRWDALELGFKAYPCCRLIHRHIDAAMEIARSCDYDWRTIREIRITSCPMVEPMASVSRVNCEPKARLEAQFSIPWTVACALIREKVAIDEFGAEAFGDPDLSALAWKVHNTVREELRDLDDPAEVTVVTDTGKFTAYTGKPLGSHENPISHEALTEKFYDCAAHSVKAFARSEVQDLAELIGDLESQPDEQRLLAALRALAGGGNAPV